MSQKNITIRLNLEDDEDRRAWNYLRHMDRTRYKSYSRAVAAAVNDYFHRQERLEADPYLETREKEDAFLRRVLETMEYGLRSAAPLGALLQHLTISQRIAPVETESNPARDAEQEESDRTALSFIDSL